MTLTANSTAVWGVAVGYVLGALAIWLVDSPATRDPGHYVESWATFALGFTDPPHDKLKHALAACVLGVATVLVLLTMRAPHPLAWSFAFVMFGGVLLEAIEWYPRTAYTPTQRRGRFSVYDLAADAIGAEVGVLLGALIYLVWRAWS